MRQGSHAKADPARTRRNARGDCRASAVLALGALLAAGVAAGEAPRIRSYASQNARAGGAFTGAAAEVERGGPVTWSLAMAPAGMTIGAATGVPTWSAPTAGSHRIRLRATNSAGEDVLEWRLVVADAYAGQQLVPTRLVDFVVPAAIAAWMARWQPHEAVDGAFEWLRDTVGQEGYAGRQMVLLDPGMGGGAHSGNPIRMGPGWWKDDPVHGWYVFVTLFVHEHAHNAHYLAAIPEQNEWPWFDPWVHHMCEFSQQGVIAAILADPARFGLTGEALSNFQAFAEWLEADYETRYAPYAAWLAAGGKAAGYAGDAYGAWQKIVHDLVLDFGAEALRTVLLAYRPDGMPPALRSRATTPDRRVTLLFAVLSAAVGTDLSGRLAGLGFAVDAPFYSQVRPEVEAVVASLPAAAFTRWHRSPVNGRYYGLTSLDVAADEAVRCAARAGGTLATVRSPQEMDWLKTTFGARPFWIGLTDADSEGTWAWMSGEPVTFTDWMSGEPNGGTGENSVATNWWGLEGWIDVGSNSVFQALVEAPEYPLAAGTRRLKRHLAPRP